MIRYLLVEKFGQISHSKKRSNNGGSRFLFSDSSYAKFSNNGQLIYFCGPLERVEKIAGYVMCDTFIEDTEPENVLISLDDKERGGEAEINLFNNITTLYCFDRIKRKILIERIPITKDNSFTVQPSVIHEISLSCGYNREDIKNKMLKRFRDIIFCQNQL